MQAAMATDTDYAWAAGFFDGEGCVCVLPNHSKTSASPSFSLKLKVTQVDPLSLENLKRILGGSYSAGPRKRLRNGVLIEELYYHWWLSGHAALEALCRMLPFLTLKRKRAEVAIEFRVKMEARKNSGSRRLTDKQVAEGQHYYDLMHILNVSPTAAERAAATTKRVDPSNGDAIVWSAVDDKAAEVGRNDQLAEGR